MTTVNFALSVEMVESPELDVMNQSIAHSHPQARHSMTADEKSALLAKEKSAKSDLFPFESNFVPGKVISHSLETKSPVVNNFFVIGDDPASLKWLKGHKNFLKENKALGFITNVASKDRLVAIEKQTGWQPLLPVSMQGGEEMLDTSHLPLMVVNKEVSQ